MYTLRVTNTTHQYCVCPGQVNVNIKSSTIDCGPKKKGFYRGIWRGVYLECTLTVDSVVDTCLLSLSVGNGYYAYRLQHMLTLFIDFMGIKTQQLQLLIIFYLLLNHFFTKYSCMHPLHTFYSVNEKL